jgi:hypothetical protein
MGTTNDFATVSAGTRGVPGHGVRPGPSRWSCRGLILACVIAAAATAIAFVYYRHWFAAVDLVSLLYVLPCVAIILICMKHMNHNKQVDAARASERSDATTDSDARN